MSEQTSLKEQNTGIIRLVLGIHVVVFVYVAFEPDILAQLAWPNAFEKSKAALAPGFLSLAIIVLAKIVLLGLVPDPWRDRLIHLRWRHPLPG